MALLIRSGPAQVIELGSVTAFAGHPLQFLLDLPEKQFLLELRFRSEPDAANPSVESRPTEAGLLLELVNFDSAEGRGSASPVLLDDLGDDLLFFHFRVFRYGRTDDRTVDYTFYRVEKKAVGWTPVDPLPHEG